MSGVYSERDKPVERFVVEIFPGDIIEPGSIGNAQAKTQPRVLRLGFAQAAAPAVPDIAAEESLIKTLAQGLDRFHLGRADAPGAAARSPDAQEEILQLQLGKGRGKIGGRLAGRGGQDLRPIAALGSPDQQIEIEIGYGAVHDGFLTGSRTPMRLTSPLCRRFAFPCQLDTELRLSAGGGYESSSLPGELQTELDLDTFRSVREIAELARHGECRRLDRLECRFEGGADGLDHLAGVQPAGQWASALLHFDQDIP